MSFLSKKALPKLLRAIVFSFLGLLLVGCNDNSPQYVSYIAAKGIARRTLNTGSRSRLSAEQKEYVRRALNEQACRGCYRRGEMDSSPIANQSNPSVVDPKHVVAIIAGDFAESFDIPYRSALAIVRAAFSAARGDFFPMARLGLTEAAIHRIAADGNLDPRDSAVVARRLGISAEKLQGIWTGLITEAI